MSTIRYTEDHEWVRMEDDGSGVVGITHHAQELLGDLVFVELPEVGRELEQGEEAGVVESVKAAGDLKTPVGGTVTEINEAMVDDPALVNSDPTGDGWCFKLTLADAGELDKLMDDHAYQAFIAE